LFPLFEFEIKGGLDELIELEMELLEFLGFGKRSTYGSGDYLDIAEKYNTKFIEHEQEQKIYKDFGSAFFLKNFVKN
jgi:hypothetical protein